LQQASADDVIIIAGKGHERYQLIGNQRLAFDDAAIVMQLAAALSSQNQPDCSRVQA
jgi:UDP-N-acetylmuramoyl-L-alanyl-D-glutamate--2,6-diaminopimelate ligase